MFIAIFVILLIAWLLAWAAFHVAGGLIHLLLIVAVISLIVHFVRGRRTVCKNRSLTVAARNEPRP